MSLGNLRLDRLSMVRDELATKRAQLRTAQDYLHSARLRAELRLVDVVAGDTKQLGTNAEDRKRAFDAACEQDDDCRDGLGNVRTLEADIAALEAEQDAIFDLRREREWDIREQLVRALEHRQIESVPNMLDVPL